jgi:hypothetical protein
MFVFAYSSAVLYLHASLICFAECQQCSNEGKSRTAPIEACIHSSCIAYPTQSEKIARQRAAAEEEKLRVLGEQERLRAELAEMEELQAAARAAVS